MGKFPFFPILIVSHEAIAAHTARMAMAHLERHGLPLIVIENPIAGQLSPEIEEECKAYIREQIDITLIEFRALEIAAEKVDIPSKTGMTAISKLSDPVQHRCPKKVPSMSTRPPPHEGDFYI